MRPVERMNLALTDFQPPHLLQFRGSRLARRVLALFGWRVLFEGLPALQGVLVVYPHTSNWDFIVMVLAKWSVGVPVQFWGKARLFRIPVFGRWLRWLGGIPVERTAPAGVVGQMVEQFAQRQAQGHYLWLGLAPEGTRKYIAGWRSGFYSTTVQARVPLGVVQLDYRRKQVRVLDFLTLCGDPGTDMARIASLYEGVQGLRHGAAAPIALLDAAVPRSSTVV